MTRELALSHRGVAVTLRVRLLARTVAVAVALAVAATFSQPISWGDAFRPGASAKVDPGLVQAAQAHPGSMLSVIVREAIPSLNAAERLVRSAGGAVTRELPIIGSFAARVPASSLSSLAASPAIWRVWGDAKLHTEGYGIGKYDTLPENTTWKQGIHLLDAQGLDTGAGVGVALIDTGVSPTRTS